MVSTAKEALKNCDYEEGERNKGVYVCACAKAEIHKRPC